jgi:hypothetical protein
VHFFFKMIFLTNLFGFRQIFFQLFQSQNFAFFIKVLKHSLSFLLVRKSFFPHFNFKLQKIYKMISNEFFWRAFHFCCEIFHDIVKIFHFPIPKTLFLFVQRKRKIALHFIFFQKKCEAKKCQMQVFQSFCLH